MELRKIEEIERAISALSAQERQELYERAPGPVLRAAD